MCVWLLCEVVVVDDVRKFMLLLLLWCGLHAVDNNLTVTVTYTIATAIYFWRVCSSCRKFRRLTTRRG